MAEWTLPLTAEGSVTAPSGVFTFVSPNAQTRALCDSGPVTILELPEFGYALADGVAPLQLLTKGVIYDAGAVAPSAAPALSVTGGAARATRVGTYTGQPNLNDTITLGRPGYQFTVTFRTIVAGLVTDGSVGHQVLLGATDDDTYTNLQKFLNNTGTQGTHYFNLLTFQGLQDNIATVYKTECSALDTAAGTITVRHTEYGTIGNTSVSTEAPEGDVANFLWAGATFTGGADGTGTNPSSGTHRFFYTWFRSADGAESGRSPIATITRFGNTDITVGSLTGSADTTYDYIRVYATAASGTEFYLAGAVSSATTSYNFNLADSTLVVSLPWSEVNFRQYSEGIPPRGRALAYWKNRLWSLGLKKAAEYTTGSATATTGSPTVTFSVKGVTTNMRGRTFVLGSTSEEYTILAVSESTPSITLDRNFSGTTATTTFKIVDDGDASAIRASIPSLFNQWPVDQSPGRVDTDDPEGGTALLATTSRLFAFSKTSIVAVTGDDIESWEIHKVADGVGCVGPRLVVGVEGGGMFLSLDGIYAISPDEELRSASRPKAPKRVRAQGIDGTIARINWSTVEQGYSVYDRTNGVVIFGVPLDGAVVPNYEIVFDLQNGSWTTYKRAEWTSACEATLPDGSQFILAGDREGWLWHAEVGESDGCYGVECLATLTSTQTKRVLTASGAAYSTSGDGEKGKPVLVLYADGSTLAYGKVASNTATAVTLTEDLATAPAASDQIIVGGIAWQAKSGFATLREEYDAKSVRSVTIRHVPTTRGDYFFSFAVNGGSFALPPVGTGIGSLSESDGKVRHVVQWPGDSHAFNLRGFKPGGRAIIRGGVIDLVKREKGGV